MHGRLAAGIDGGGGEEGRLSYQRVDLSRSLPYAT